MFTKHFFKILILFAGMIAMGLIGIFLVSHFDRSADPTTAGVPPCENEKLC